MSGQQPDTVIDRRTFYREIRNSLFRGRLSQSQVDGMENLLDAWQRDFAGFDSRWLAYCLATAYHETARTMQPVREFGKGRGRRYGKPDKRTGQVYYGRGHVQLTWAENYRRAAEAVNADLYNNPDLALDASISAQILFQGCISGWFTGRKLGEFIRASRPDYVSARKVVNGTDQAELIAGYARAFEAATKMRTAPLHEPSSGAEGHTTGKPAMKSSTNWSAAVSIFTGVVTASAAAVRDVAEALGPVGAAALAGLGIAAGIYIIRERKMKSYMEGV